MRLASVTLPRLREAGPLDQLLAIARDLHAGDIVLSGAAGTGKTTLVRGLLEDLGGTEPLLLAPTGKAAQRLREVTGKTTQTIHSALYGAPSEQWVDGDDVVCKGRRVDDKLIEPPCEGCACRQILQWTPGSSFDGRLVIVDEASMVGAAVAGHLRQAVHDRGGRILWVGDPAQLPPVGDDPGVDLSDADIHLEQVHRSERAGILELATRIRHAKSGLDLTRALSEALQSRAEGIEIGPPGWGGVAKWRSEDATRMLIVHRNADRQRINADVRTVLGCRAVLHRRELVLVRKNEGGMLNGQIGRVQAVEPISGPVLRVTADFDGHIRTFALRADCLGAETNQRFMRGRRDARAILIRHGRGEVLVNAQYGYALTCHAAQGSEANEVGVVWTHRDIEATDLPARFDDLRRWLYTAITRARQSVTLWVGP